ncbi:MAG TPA: hypothetical protein VM493_05695 [Vicinamibacterales bacterium]|nr:hypothetical protein [Vicinamibacterales bacterium]
MHLHPSSLLARVGLLLLLLLALVSQHNSSIYATERALAASPPIGTMDTPGHGAVVSGEMAVTGWALDDMSVEAVRIYRRAVEGEPTGARGLVFVGDATFVNGARPDVASAYSQYPLRERAGWGYMLLTNMLPNGGNGVFTIYAIAQDNAGTETVLGEKTVTATNTGAGVPFGTIDAPAQGAVVAGVIDNFGWVLARQPAIIPTDGSTITVYVDNVAVGRPSYNHYRADIASSFAGYRNSGGAVGHFRLDTRSLADGVHTLSWVAVDSSGRAQGIGSRHITVENQPRLPSFKLAAYNLQSGRGEPGLAGRAVLFTDNMNCTDSSQPMNAWGVGFVQQHLRAALADPSVVALTVTEAWLCASPKNVRQALGWKANTSERNGIAVVARYGFAGAEEWVQLDTSLNTNPADTMWVLRVPVCLNAACSVSLDVFSSHWFAAAPTTLPQAEYTARLAASYDRQARQTVEFLQRRGTGLHVLIGDLNTWEAPGPVCGHYPMNAGLAHLRAAGYSDAWPLLHGSAEGNTGMINRPGCGVPEGNVWKRPDYVWAPAYFLPVSITRFGMVTPGDAAPSDHLGLIVEFRWPGR